MIYIFGSIIQDYCNFPVPCALILNMHYWDILDSRLEYHDGTDSVLWFVIRINYDNRIFRDNFKINLPLKEKIIAPPTTNIWYCKEELCTLQSCLVDDRGKHHDHLNGVFKNYAHNKCNTQATTNVLPSYNYNASTCDNQIFIAKFAKFG